MENVNLNKSPVPPCKEMPPVNGTSGCNKSKEHLMIPNSYSQPDNRFEKFGTVSFTGVSRVNGFIDYLENGLVTGTKCKKCGTVYFPPRADCVHCMASEMEWFGVEGNGELLSFSTINFAPEGFAQDLPYTVAVLGYEEYKIFGRIDSSLSEDDLYIGMKMRTVSHCLRNGNLNYVFEKAESPKSRLDSIIGRRIDLKKAEENDFDFDDSNYENPVLHLPLFDFETGNSTDRNGFNAYAVVIFLENMVVKGFQRVGYLQFRGGGSIDCKLDMFKSHFLEDEAERKIMKILYK